jgi:hypothetical protein
VTQKADGPEDGMVNFDGPGRESQPMPGQEPQPSSLSPDRLAELRLWVARYGYNDPQIDRLVATRILEQGDL